MWIALAGSALHHPQPRSVWVSPAAGGRLQACRTARVVSGRRRRRCSPRRGYALGAGDGGDVVALRQQPGEGDLGRRGADLAARAATSSARRRLRWKFSPVKRGLPCRKSSSAKSSVERIVPVRKPRPAGERHEADAEFAQRRQDPLLRAPGPQRVLRLHRGDRVNGVRAADGVRAGLGEAEGADLALGDQLADRADGLLDRGVRVDPVLVVQVDVVGAEPLQRALDGRADVGRPAVEIPGPAPACETRPNFVASTTWSRRPFRARPRSSSLTYGP